MTQLDSHSARQDGSSGQTHEGVEQARQGKPVAASAAPTAGTQAAPLKTPQLGLRPAAKPPIVDTKDTASSAPPSSIVDTKETKASGPMLRPWRPSSSIVDTNDPHGRKQIKHATVDTKDKRSGGNASIVDTKDDGYDALPAAPVATRIKGPEQGKQRGPNEDHLKSLRDAHKRKLAERAKANGRDPGANSTEVVQGMTRSEKTHEKYLERGRALVRRYRKETGNVDTSIYSLDPVEFTNWFFSLKPTLKSSAWRPYRQSAKAILSTIPHDNIDEAIAMIDADISEGLTSKSTSTVKDGIENRAKMPKKTSAAKEKKFPKNDFDKVLSTLKYFSRSKFAPSLADWLVAGISTGLRPIEWATTELEIKNEGDGQREAWLYVLNAKSTNGRANGVVRTLDLSNFSDETLRAVQRMSETGNEWFLDGSFDSMKSQCSQLLYSVSEKLFKGRNKIYSLYSLRHQFMSNAKTYHKPEAVAALAGHGVDNTASENYGKKRSSWGPDEIVDRANPVSEEVASVRQTQNFYDARQKLKVEAGLIKAPKFSGEEY